VSRPALNLAGIQAYDFLMVAKASLPLRVGLSIATMGWAHEKIIWTLESWLAMLQYEEPAPVYYVENEVTREALTRSGVALPVSYVAWEAAFWTAIAVTAVTGYPKEFFGVDARSDVTRVSAQALDLLNLARLDATTRLGLAVLTAPWADETLVDHVVGYLRALTYGDQPESLQPAVAYTGQVVPSAPAYAEPAPITSYEDYVRRRNLYNQQYAQAAPVPAPVAAPPSSPGMTYEEYVRMRNANA